MLVLRREQIAALSVLTRSNFEKKILEQVKELYSEQYDRMGDQKIRSAIHRSINRAMVNGFESEQDLARFVFLCFSYGSDFDSDLDWAEQILLSSLSPEEKMSSLWNQALKLETQTMGYESVSKSN